MDTVDIELLRVLEDLRKWAGDLVHISSGCRCKAYNSTVKDAAPNSYHTRGKAADVKVGGKTPDEVQEYLLSKYPGKYGIGRYNTFTHIDVRAGRRGRWDFRTKPA